MMNNPILLYKEDNPVSKSKQNITGKQMKKSERQAEAMRKAKQKKIIIISVCVSIVLIIAALLIFNAYQQKDNRVYSDGHQTITLRDDGSFTAALAHNEKWKGRYTEDTKNSVTTVTFVVDRTSVNGSIRNNILTIPDEWQDDHGHGSKLKLK